MRRRRSNRVMHFKRSTVSDITVPPAGFQESLSFALSDVSASGEFSALFGQYRINKVVVKYEPQFNISSTAALNTRMGVIDFHKPEPMGGTFNQDLALEQQTHRIRNNLRGWSRKFTPALTGVVATSSSGTTFVGSAPKYKQWLETSALAIPHFGYNVIFTPHGGVATVGQSYKRYTHYYFSCKTLQ